MHPDLDTKPAKNPFARYPVVGYRHEQGEVSEEHFFVLEVDLTRDDVGPMTPPVEMTEEQARGRLAALGLAAEDIEARVAFAKRWMATRILQLGAKSVMQFPTL